MTTRAEVRPCVICKAPVPRELFQAGQAKVIGGALCCPDCVQDAERAKQETVVFREGLDPGASYACEGCATPISIGEIQGGGVVFYERALSCTKCSSDLLEVLARGRARRAPPPRRAGGPPAAKASQASQPKKGTGGVEHFSLEEEPEGDPPPPARPSKSPSQSLPRQKSGRAPTGGSQRAGAPTGKSQRSATVSAKQNKPQVSGRFGNCPTCDDALGKHTVEFGGRHLCVQCKPILRRLLAGTELTVSDT